MHGGLNNVEIKLSIVGIDFGQNGLDTFCDLFQIHILANIQNNLNLISEQLSSVLLKLGICERNKELDFSAYLEDLFIDKAIDEFNEGTFGILQAGDISPKDIQISLITNQKRSFPKLREKGFGLTH